jgi:EmrB/QacA subfamily drug resistance transporter
MTAQQATAHEDVVPDDAAQVRYAWRVLTCSSLGIVTVALGSSTLDVALPAVVRGTGASPTQAAWLLLGYLLAQTAGVLVFGRIADVLGRRPSYIWGLAAFSVASLLCALVSTAGPLLVLRTIQGLCAAAVVTNITPLVADAFPERLRMVGLGYNMAVVSIAQVAGPLVGGVLADQAGWRAVFWAFGPVGLLSALWSMRVLKKEHGHARGERFDVVGALLSVIALGTTVAGTSLLGTEGIGDPLVLAMLGVAVVSWPAFVFYESRQATPIVPPVLFRDRERVIGFFGALASSMARLSVLLLVAIYLQATRGMTATEAGVHVVPLALGMLVAAPLAGRLARRVAARTLTTTGMGITVAGMVLLAVSLDPHGTTVPITIGLSAVGFGSGLFSPPNTNSLVGHVPRALRGSANAVRSTMVNGGYVLGTAIGLAVATGSLPDAERDAAYAGRLRSLPGAELGPFTSSTRLAVLVLGAPALVALVLQRWRPKTLSTPSAVAVTTGQPVPEPGPPPA